MLILRIVTLELLLEVPVHRGAAMEPIRKLAQEKIMKIEGVTSATVVITAHESKQKVLQMFPK